MDILLLIIISFIIFFIIGTLIKNNAIVDIGWGIGFIIVAWYTYYRDSSVVLGQWIITILLSLWGLRLIYHIAKNNFSDRQKSHYNAYREAWGKRMLPKVFLQIYILQGLFLYLISLTVIMTSKQGVEADPISLLPGVLLWFLGFFFEAVGDYQLVLFSRISDIGGKSMASGLWSLTHHPNYIGEAAMWWGIFLIAIISGAPLWTVLSPVILTLLLIFVSGVPFPKNSQKKETRYEYADKTNKFYS